MRICSGPGCLRAVRDDVRFCDECATEHKQDRPSGAQRASADEILRQYSLPRWNKGIRPRVLQRYPFCVDCGINPSTVADHDIPARLIVRVCRAERIFPFDPWGGFYIMSNLKGRCHSCHNAKTKVEDAQDWTAELERVLGPYRTKDEHCDTGGTLNVRE